MLTIVGVCVGLLAPYLGSLEDTIVASSEISPHTILLLFLPALLFESAFHSDWHLFKKQLSQILLLAGPILLVGAFLTAFILDNVVPEKLTSGFIGALVFGSIVSATDPVAVVALLKELGASKRLSTLIEGESLLNDGTAMVLFAVILVL